MEEEQPVVEEETELPEITEEARLARLQATNSRWEQLQEPATENANFTGHESEASAGAGTEEEVGAGD